MKKIIIIGDSFVEFPLGEETHGSKKVTKTWVRLLNDNVKEYQLVVDGQPSRDIQTIIDKWILYLDKINSDDILIICVPTFHRTRLPLKKSNWSEIKTEDWLIINKFIGANFYKEGDNNIDGFEYRNTENHFELIKFYEVLNSSCSSITNHLEIMNSLKKITPCYTYLFSWDNIEYENEIEDRTVLINKIGYWETLNDIFEHTNGENGIYQDQHWSKKNP